LQILGAIFQCVRRFIHRVSQTLLNRLLTFRKNGTNHTTVYFLSAHRHRQIQIQAEYALDKPINWKPFENFFFGEFDDAKQSENDPIRQPLRIVHFRRRFDGFDGNVSRIHEANKIAKQFSEMTENQVQSQ